MKNILIMAFLGLMSYYASAKATASSDSKDTGFRCEIRHEEQSIKFHDKKGRLIKNLLLKSTPSCESGRKKTTHFELVGCFEGNFGASIKRKYDCLRGDEEGAEVISMTLDVYSAGGKKIWSRSLEKCCWGGGTVRMAPNDRKIAYIQYGDKPYSLVVFDELGNEQRFTLEEQMDVMSQDIWFSPNARYVWVLGWHPSGKNYPQPGWPPGPYVSGTVKYVFIDLHTSNRHEFIGKASVRIDDNGLVRAFESGYNKVDGTYIPEGKLLHSYQFP